MVEQRIHKPRVVGSSPILAISCCTLSRYCDSTDLSGLVGFGGLESSLEAVPLLGFPGGQYWGYSTEPCLFRPEGSVVFIARSPSMLDFGVRLPREGEAPAEPLTGFDASPGSRLSRSFALPDGPGSTPNPNVDKALGQKALVSGSDESKGPMGRPFERSPHDRRRRMAGLSALESLLMSMSRASSPGWENGWPFRPKEWKNPCLPGWKPCLPRSSLKAGLQPPNQALTGR